MHRTDRLALANWAVTVLAPRVHSEGRLIPADGRVPSHRELVIDGATILPTEQVLLASNENALSSVVDVWPEPNGPKVLSVT